ncbi:MAG: tRNA pseudouridine(55) synthase TruB [Mycoplasmataceae bacterium]|nr:tRNA pseudouridine(55) synthase TruB [Mycoplasmataceae bacterium]
MFKLIYKKSGESSFKSISNFARENNIKKIGHTGTLDPMARGLLLVATDNDTKLIPYITNTNKTYIAEAIFNIETNTYDSEGEIINTYEKIITLEMIEDIIPSFTGKIKQIPPIFSAKKINGKRAYDLARENKEVTLKSVDVEIYYINIISFSNNKLVFEVSVSSGTYIRSLIHDFGKVLHSGAHMSSLERTMIHGISKENINDQVDLKQLINLPFLEVPNATLKNLFNGLKTIIEKEDNQYALFFENDIIGIIKISCFEVVERKLFGNKIEGLVDKKNTLFGTGDL